ncbi:MAG: PRC-barrel domain-containing protein [Candidatus Methanoperedenaceae archaeon]|nr:PRC-barrel domain-containing protein [Candidatus Methanoperedenaceae archaeon]
MHIEVSSLFGLNVYTDKGIYIGKINDVLLEVQEKKAMGLGVTKLNPEMFDTTKSGVIIPFRWVTAVGDVLLIRHLANHFTKSGEMVEDISLYEEDEQ